jgi:putative salt-induced outer membrane protein YdiY
MRVRACNNPRTMAALTTLAAIAFLVAQQNPPTAPPPAQDPAQAPVRTERVKGSLDFNFDRSKGNTNSVNLGIRSDLTVRFGAKWSLTENLTLAYGRASLLLVAFNISNSTKFAYEVSNRFSVFGELFFFRDRLTPIPDQRTLAVGADIRVLMSRRHKLTLSPSVGRDTQGSVTGGPAATGILTINYRLAFTDRNAITHNTLWMVSFYNTDWQRVESTTTLELGILKQLSLTASHRTRYQPVVLPGTRRLDLTETLGVMFKF